MLKHLLLHKIKRERNIKKRRCHTLETQEERLYEKASEPRREIYRISVEKRTDSLRGKRAKYSMLIFSKLRKETKYHFSV